MGEGHTTGASPASSLCPGSILVAQTKCVIESATNGHISAHYSACYYRDNFLSHVSFKTEFGTQFYFTYVTLVYWNMHILFIFKVLNLEKIFSQWTQLFLVFLKLYSILINVIIIHFITSFIRKNIKPIWLYLHFILCLFNDFLWNCFFTKLAEYWLWIRSMHCIFMCLQGRLVAKFCSTLSTSVFLCMFLLRVLRQSWSGRKSLITKFTKKTTAVVSRFSNLILINWKSPLVAIICRDTIFCARGATAATFWNNYMV